MGIIVLEDWKQKGILKYGLVIDEDMAELVATLSDEEMQTIKQKINKEIVTLHDIREHVKKNKFTISKKTEAEVYNILRSRGYNNKHIAKIMSYLREKGLFKNITIANEKVSTQNTTQYTTNLPREQKQRMAQGSSQNRK